MSDHVVSTDYFVGLIKDLLVSDRWVLIAVDGEMGEGKSRFMSFLAEKVAAALGTPFSYDDNMTYSRAELTKWIDGEGEERKGQKPERSVIIADELISMFFNRNWHDVDQIAGVELLNKCRDRHLCVLGAVPNFWHLDSVFQATVTFRVFIYKRGVAWVFRKDTNPFAKDKWHVSYNEKVFQKAGSPHKCKGFLCELRFPDWSDEDKKRYYSVRNVKRRGTEAQVVREKYRHIKIQRDRLVKCVMDNVDGLTLTRLRDEVLPMVSIETLSKAFRSLRDANFRFQVSESGKKNTG